MLQKFRELPPEKQQQVLNFLDALTDNGSPQKPRRSLRGLWKNLNIQITEQDIAEVRREMWGNFPRDLD